MNMNSRDIHVGVHVDSSWIDQFIYEIELIS